MSRLDNALRNLGRATLLDDSRLRARSMGEILHLAGVGSDVVDGGQRAVSPPALHSSTPWGEHPEVDDIRRLGRNTRGTIEGQPAQLYFGNGYRSIVRSLARDGRCHFRPAKGPGGREALWLTDSEVATVRAEHRSRYQTVTL